MELIESLKFVQGAIAAKSPMPAMTHVNIGNGRIQSHNGVISLDAPLGIDLRVTPLAKPFLAAVQRCEGSVAMDMTKGGRLRVKNASFSAYIDCMPKGEFPDNAPEGSRMPLSTPILNALERCVSFVATDDSRMWAKGILFRGANLFATNNICVIRQALDNPFPVEANVPVDAIVELLRLKTEPVAVQISERSITFLFEHGGWLKARLYDLNWPDFDGILSQSDKAMPWPPFFFEALDNILPFVDDQSQVFLEGRVLSTHREPEIGARQALDANFALSCFDAKQLSKLREITDRIDLSVFPKPCIFAGGNDFRGAIVGKVTL